ncbi:drug/metabolite transporter (DMT)-like permease [Rubricella aquisinus]|uniref:Drug/metabolite transporter (DMT)-like permease n=1 Tax=Rubricella aquisinus TaxID=2028108 RepID=A0A840X5W0_9RHOB|nr:DMT family transporter [Rubricella aquisinus]MBB5516097.1 drug/metabolite transporter (DMT)-like permease [Rubricella aquisinus]
MTRHQPDWRDFATIAALGFIWGSSFMAVELAIDGFGPLTVAAGRIVLGAVALILIARVAGQHMPKDRRVWLAAAGMGIMANALPFTLISFGQQNVTSAFAGIAMAVVPLLILPLAHILVPGERLNWLKALGVTAGFIGVVVLIGPGPGLVDAPILSMLACVAAACCYAVASIITRLSPPAPTLAFSAAGLAIASAVMIPITLAFEGLPTAWPMVASLGVLYLGLIPTGLATLLLVFVIQRAGPSFFTLVHYQVPVWAMALGIVILGEDVPGRFAIALVLILSGQLISRRGLVK